MQRCSNTIGSIASAIAKAQTELTNPEKSMTAVIQSPFPREGTKSFRYASLASGLDVVRKVLGKNDVAVIQSTTIDWDARLIRLTTTLAHSSGEWVASDWPVCTVRDAEAPHKLGTALTYARRYGLFTLVGIAGDDDLDAPDLMPASSQFASPSAAQANCPTTQNDDVKHPHLAMVRSAAARTNVTSTPATFEPSESAAARDGLLEQLATTSADLLTEWAKHSLVTKNKLQAVDADMVSDAFATKLAAADLADDDIDAPLSPSNNASSPEKIDKSALTLSEPRRLRDKNHLRFVSTRPCLACGRFPSDPHHLKFAQPRAMARKVSDEFVVPLCRVHHRELHQIGDERTWWTSQAIDPLPVAASLWAESRGLIAGIDQQTNVATERNVKRKRQHQPNQIANYR